MTWLPSQFDRRGYREHDLHRDSEELGVLGSIAHLGQDGRELESETKSK
jgi:hypothetical protein